MGGHCMASRDETFLKSEPKKGQNGSGGHGRNTKIPQPCLPGKPSGEAQTPSEALALALALGLGLPDPLLTSGNRSGFYVWWWVFFFIILYKNKSTFRNFFLLSLSRSLSLALALIFFFFLSFRLFIEVGCNL